MEQSKSGVNGFAMALMTFSNSLCALDVRRAAAHQHYRQPGGVFVRLQAAANFVALHVRQDEIQQDQIGLLARGERQAFRSVLGEHD